MTGWTSECPVCRYDIDDHNAETARLHYATWRRSMEDLPEEPQPFSIEREDRPSFVGEWDAQIQRVFHPAGA